MRLIGHLENPGAAATFSQYLLIQGIANELEQERQGWAVWVHSEDELDKAKSLLSGYLGNPEHPKFRVASLTRATTPPPKPEKASKASVPVTAAVASSEGSSREASAVPRFAMGPLTMALLLVCVVIALASDFGESTELLAPLFVTAFEVTGSLIKWFPGMPEISSGEIWRIWTPMLIHFGPLHLFMNLLWLVYLGGMIESRERSWRLALLILPIAGISNLAQYLLSGPNFGGMSGVVYGLLGYIWMKCRHRPDCGYRLSLNTVTFMLIWFFLCLAGIIPGVANGAHTFGLLTGVAWGFLSSKWAMRRSRPH